MSLAVLAAGAAALTLALVPRGTTRHAPEGVGRSQGLVLVDLSGSVSYATAASALARTLAAEPSGRFGLVLFSDHAYEALPPDTPAREFASFVRALRRAQNLVELVPSSAGEEQLVFTENPWGGVFSSGTRISNGLEVALRVFEREPRTRRRITLISDLGDDPSDVAAMQRALAGLRRADVDIRVVPIFAAAGDAELFEQARGARARVDAGVSAPAPKAAADDRSPGATAPAPPFPLGFALAAVGLLVAFAFLERASACLDWQDAGGPSP